MASIPKNIKANTFNVEVPKFLKTNCMVHNSTLTKSTSNEVTDSGTKTLARANQDAKMPTTGV